MRKERIPNDMHCTLFFTKFFCLEILLIEVECQSSFIFVSFNEIFDINMAP